MHDISLIQRDVITRLFNTLLMGESYFISFLEFISLTHNYYWPVASSDSGGYIWREYDDLPLYFLVV
jgi:hypothetical protein